MSDIRRFNVYSDDGSKIIGAAEYRPDNGKWFAIVNGKDVGSFKSRQDADEEVTKFYRPPQPIVMEDDIW